jgi:hypothetical protein
LTSRFFEKKFQDFRRCTGVCLHSTRHVSEALLRVFRNREEIMSNKQSDRKRSRRGKLQHKPPSQWMMEGFDSAIEPDSDENFEVVFQDDYAVAEKHRLRAASYHSRIR